ncbi:MAG: Ig-like domain-containing domain [Spirosomataceae bacterium]
MTPLGVFCSEMKRYLIISICWLLAFWMYSCAQFVPPTGGKKDTIPPKLVKTIPINKTLNYKEQYVDLEFDEYITIDNLNQKLLVTPSLEGSFTVKQRPKGARLNFDKPLKENVTYTLNFRDAFKDYSERNPAKNVKLVFSTGAQIDSLAISGVVKDLQTGKPELDATVGLYKWTDTSKVSKLKPYYFTKTDTSGKFQIENIQVGTYRLFTLTDLNNNLLYDQGKEKIAYLTEPIKINQNIDNIKLELFRSDLTPQKVVTTFPTANYYTITYGRGFKKVKVNYPTPADSMPYVFPTDKQIKFFNTNNSTDTIKVSLTMLDSLDREFKHEQKIKFRPKPKREEGSKEELSITIEPKVGEEVDKKISLKLKFNKPVATFKVDNFKILEDTTRLVKLEPTDFVWNIYKNELNITKETKATRDVRITFSKGTFLSVEKDSSQSIKQDYPLRNPENYGIISGKIKNAKSNFIIQLLDNNNKVVDERYNKIDYLFEFLKPGIYQVRVIVDKNSNNQWDPGSVEKFTLPEPILLLLNPLPLKQNFELVGNDFDLAEY